MSAALATTTLEDYWFGEGAVEDADREAAQSVAALVAQVHGVKPLPMAAHKLMRVARDPNAQVAAIAKVLEGDPALLARVLRLVNSAAYGLRNPCKSARNAVTLLGPKRITEVATASAVLELFDDESAHVRQILEHALSVAAIMKRLAQKCEMSTEDAFTCGLLHDVGKLMLLQAGENDYATLLASEDNQVLRMHLREREAFGFDHGVLAGHMLRAWKIPAPVPEAVGLHHHLPRAYEVGGEVAQLVHLLRLSELLTEVVKGPNPDDEALDAIAKDESASYVELTRDDLAAVWGDVHSAIANSRRILAGGAETKGGAQADEAPPPSSHTSGVRARVVTTVRPRREPRYPRSQVVQTVAVCCALAAAVVAAVSFLH